MRYIMANVVQTNKVDAQRDVTTLSDLRQKSQIFSHLRLHFAEIFSIGKLKSLGYHVAPFA